MAAANTQMYPVVAAPLDKHHLLPEEDREEEEDLNFAAAVAQNFRGPLPNSATSAARKEAAEAFVIFCFNFNRSFVAFKCHNFFSRSKYISVLCQYQ